MKNLILPGIFLCIGNLLVAQEISIIPKPAEMIVTNHGTFKISERTAFVYDPQLLNSVAFFSGYCNDHFHFSPKMIQNSRERNSGCIKLVFDPMFTEGKYVIEVTRSEILIRGSEDGVFYGVQTLIQLLPAEIKAGHRKIEVPCVHISDQPRFSYRGMHLDVSRHFFTVDFLKQCINLAAYHKLNRFHLHLTDDQGWRIEIGKYPELTRVGAWRNGTMKGLFPGSGNDSIRHGGYYTRDEIRDLVAYAQERYITIVPEIEMPGHSLAALASYPHLGCTGGPYRVKESWGISYDVFCAGNDSTFLFLQDVLDEVTDLFPSELIHIGGDECPKVSWKNCPRCQARIKEQNLTDETELQSYFVRRIEKYLNAKGRTIIGWDEILEGGIAPNAVVMSWRGDGESGCLDAVKTGHRVIMTPSYGFYLDYPQTSHEDSLAANWGGVTSLKKVYDYDPRIEKLNDKEVELVIGGQANIWTEYMSNPAKVTYMALPRLSAVSEVLWSPRESKNWDDFKNRLQKQYKRYKLWGVCFNPANPDDE